MSICSHDWAAYLVLVERATLAQERSATALELIAESLANSEAIQEAIKDMRKKTAALGGAIPNQS